MSSDARGGGERPPTAVPVAARKRLEMVHRLRPAPAGWRVSRGAAQARVQQIAHRVAEQVEGVDRHRQAQARPTAPAAAQSPCTGGPRGSACRPSSERPSEPSCSGLIAVTVVSTMYV